MSVIGAEPIAPRCSRARCRADAAHAIRWRNPRIHAEGGAGKTWLACPAHVDELRDFLAQRGFPLRVEPFAPSAPGPSA